ncbi:MAG TPA: DUF4386 family protein [Anaerolineae bacterium]
MTNITNADAAWKPLYKVGGVAALIVAVFIPIQVILFMGWPPPSSVAGYFTLFQNNRLLGLIDLDLLMIIDELLMVPVLLALYIALRHASPSAILLATAFGLIAVVLYCVSREATFTMPALSDHYAAATTEAQKSIYLATGQTMLAMFDGTAFDLYYILGAVSSLITSVVMLRNKLFGKATAYAGLVTSVLMLVPPTVGMVGLILSLLSLAPTMVWLILIGRRLLQSGQLESGSVSELKLEPARQMQRQP